LEGLGDARWTDPASAKTANVQFALRDCIFIGGEGGEKGILVVMGAVV